MMIKFVAKIAAAGFVVFATVPAAAVMIFDGSTLPRQASGQFGANSGALGRYTFASSTTISSFSTLLALGTASNLKFQIYDSTIGTLLYTSAAKAFAADASASMADGTFKKSDLFSYTFVAGTTYAIGAISDNGPFVIGSLSTKSEGGVTALLENQNVIDNVFSTNRACCSVPAQFFTGEVAVVPEPMTWSLMITGFALVGAAARRRNWTMLRHG